MEYTIKENLISICKQDLTEKRRNSMGCCEGWYDFFYAMKQTFTIEEMEAMTQHEINLLERLHHEVAEGLY